jgi:hypothetical protein
MAVNSANVQEMKQAVNVTSLYLLLMNLCFMNIYNIITERGVYKTSGNCSAL